MLKELHKLAQDLGGEIVIYLGVFPTVVGGYHKTSVGCVKVGYKTHTKVCAHPDAVDDTLIIDVSGKLVFSVHKVVGDVEFVVMIGFYVSGGRSLTDKATVYVIFSVIVGRDAEDVSTLCFC